MQLWLGLVVSISLILGPSAFAQEVTNNQDETVYIDAAKFVNRGNPLRGANGESYASGNAEGSDGILTIFRSGDKQAVQNYITESIELRYADGSEIQHLVDSAVSIEGGVTNTLVYEDTKTGKNRHFIQVVTTQAQMPSIVKLIKTMDLPDVISSDGKLGAFAETDAGWTAVLRILVLLCFALLLLYQGSWKFSLDLIIKVRRRVHAGLPGWRENDKWTASRRRRTHTRPPIPRLGAASAGESEALNQQMDLFRRFVVAPLNQAVQSMDLEKSIAPEAEILQLFCNFGHRASDELQILKPQGEQNQSSAPVAQLDRASDF